MKSPIIAILASGEGTTAEAFIRAGAKNLSNPQIALVICSKPNAGIFARIDKLNKEFGLNIVCKHISKTNYPPADDEEVAPGEQTAAEEQAIIDVLKKGNYNAIVLMGYMKKVGPSLVRDFGWQARYRSPYQANMLNTHPGLLPETKAQYGIHVQEHVLDKHLPQSGQTLHIVAEDYDDGPTVAEHKVAVEPNDTPASLFERVQQTEKKYLPIDIAGFIKKRQSYLNKIET